MLDRLAALPIPGDEAPRGTVVDLSQESRPQRGVVSTLDLVPHLSVRIAEARARTQRLRIREREGGSFQDLRLFAIRGTGGGFGAVEADLRVGAVAERLGFRLTAPAQLVRLPSGQCLALPPLLRLARVIGDDGLLGERHAAAHQVGTVARDDHPGARAGLRHRGPPSCECASLNHRRARDKSAPAGGRLPPRGGRLQVTLPRMRWLTPLFILAVLGSLAIELWLSRRQARAVACHRDSVPGPFAGSVSASEHGKAADYTLAKLRLGRIVSLVDAALTLLLTVEIGRAHV